MQIVDDFVASAFALDRSVVGIGVFDGIHVAHQRLIETTVEVARRDQAASVVLTFEPHPQEVIRGTPMPRLMSLDRRLEIFQALGVDVACVIRFSRNVARVTAEEFVHRSLVGRLHVRTVVVGFNFTFGQGAHGTPATLKAMGETLGFECTTIPTIVVEGIAVSSSSVRSLIEQGEVVRAAKLLGRPYALTGTVVKGEGRGHTLGFATANLATVPANQVRPRRGVYVARAKVGGRGHTAVVNVGVAPTFRGDQAPVRIEAHLLGFDEDILGRPLELELTRFLRDERQFASAQDLVAQIRQDVVAAGGNGKAHPDTGDAVSQQDGAAAQHPPPQESPDPAARRLSPNPARTPRTPSRRSPRSP